MGAGKSGAVQFGLSAEARAAAGNLSASGLVAFFFDDFVPYNAPGMYPEW